MSYLLDTNAVIALLDALIDVLTKTSEKIIVLIYCNSLIITVELDQTIILTKWSIKRNFKKLQVELRLSRNRRAKGDYWDVTKIKYTLL